MRLAGLRGIGRSKLYELIAAGEIEIIKVGTITLIPTGSLQSFVQLRRNGRSAPIAAIATPPSLGPKRPFVQGVAMAAFNPLR